MKIAVFHYSQTGQAATAARNLFSTVDASTVVKHKAIRPVQDFPFPWDLYKFFDAFPETRLGLPPTGIQPIDFQDIADADLVVVVGQSWFLSPPLPLQSFFADSEVKAYLSGRKVVFVNVCRNMWLMTIRWVKAYLKSVGAELVGHIVLQDHHNNLVSAATVVRWLIHGRKEASRLLPTPPWATTRRRAGWA